MCARHAKSIPDASLISAGFIPQLSLAHQRCFQLPAWGNQPKSGGGEQRPILPQAVLLYGTPHNGRIHPRNWCNAAGRKAGRPSWYPSSPHPGGCGRLYRITGHLRSWNTSYSMRFFRFKHGADPAAGSGRSCALRRRPVRPSLAVL